MMVYLWSTFHGLLSTYMWSTSTYWWSTWAYVGSTLDFHVVYLWSTYGLLPLTRGLPSAYGLLLAYAWSTLTLRVVYFGGLLDGQPMRWGLCNAVPHWADIYDAHADGPGCSTINDSKCNACGVDTTFVRYVTLRQHSGRVIAACTYLPSFWARNPCIGNTSI